LNRVGGQDNFAFLKAHDGLWDAMLESLRPLKLKKVSVTLHGLCRREEITPDLFNTASPACQKLGAQHDALSKAMDRLNEKYGAETIRLGISPQTSAGFVGTKISFTRVPDLSEFKN
jgi:DNA polymerase-4